MKKPSEYKALARQKMFNKFGMQAAATAIYGGIYVFIAMVALFAYATNLMSKGVFESLETMQNYMDMTATSNTYYFATEGIILLISALMSTLSVAIQYMCLNVARGKDIKISDLLYVIKNNPDRVLIIFLAQNIFGFLCTLPANLLATYVNQLENAKMLIFVYYVLMIIGYMADIIVITLFSQAMFIFVDDPTLTSITCIRASIAVMKKNIAPYIRLFISFIPLYLMASFTLGIGFIWVIPYQYTTFALFYMQLKGELGSTVDVTV